MTTKLKKLGSLSCIFMVLFFEVCLLQWIGGAYSSGFGEHPDEAAHFVSAIMVHDFIKNFGAGQPMAFAQDFYLHYPKVAIGNWPPLQYALMAAWFLVAGVSRVSALLFIAIAAALTATAMYAIGKKLLSPLAGLFASALFIALPLVQQSSDAVMVEHLVTLLMLLSALQFARFVETRTTIDALIFGSLSTAAILTRGSAWALLFVPPMVILIQREWRLLRNWRLWASAVPVILLCVPWYVLTRHLSRGAMFGTDPQHPLSFLSQAIVIFPVYTVQATGALLSCLAGIGLWSTLIAPRSERSVYWAALVSIALGVLTIQCVVPASLEARFIVQLLPSFMLLSAAGAHRLIGALPSINRLRSVTQPAAWLIVAIVSLATIFDIPNQVRNNGYDAIASVLMAEAKRTGGASLVVSDSIGEGSIVAAVAVNDNRPHVVVVRGSKVLTNEDWLGRDSRERFSSPAELRRFLNEIPISAVVIDQAIDPQWRRPYHTMVAQLMVSQQSEWMLQGTYDLVRNGRDMPQSARVFVRRPDTGSRFAQVINMQKLAKSMQGD
jgi:hypothetical protein